MAASLTLTGYGVGLLATAGAKRIVADTDHHNTAMRAVFARAGFVERERREIYRYLRV